MNREEAKDWMVWGLLLSIFTISLGVIVIISNTLIKFLAGVSL